MKQAGIKLSRWALVTLLFFPLGSSAEKGRRALVVIDMQQFYITRSGNAHRDQNKAKITEVINAQVEAIQAAKRTNTPVIFLEYESSPSSDHGTTLDLLRDAAKGAKDAVYFLKNSDGMFDHSNSHKKELIDYLAKMKIETLIIMGANGGSCVRSSIIGALNNNFNVVAYDKAIADFNYPEFLYPYDIYYRDIHPKCRNCFLETSLLSEIFPERNGDLSAVQDVLSQLTEILQRIDRMNPALGCGQ